MVLILTSRVIEHILLIKFLFQFYGEVLAQLHNLNLYSIILMPDFIILL